MPSWIVVIRTAIMHARYEYVARTGLFGLLGDEPVQLVNVSDEDRVKSFFDMQMSRNEMAVPFILRIFRDSAEQ